MRLFKSLIIGGIGALASFSAYAQSISELFGTAEAVWDAQVSPSGTHVALGCSPTGMRGICIYDIAHPGTKPVLLTIPSNSRPDGFHWVGSKHIVLDVNLFTTLQLQSGMKDYSFDRSVAYNVETGNAVTLLRKEARLAFDGTWIMSLKPEKDDTVLMGLPFREFETYDVNLDTGKTKKVKTYSESVFMPVLDVDGSTIATVYFGKGMNSSDKMDSNIPGMRGNSNFIIKLANGKEVYRQNNVENAPLYVLGLAPDGKNLLVQAGISNTDFRGLRVLSVETGELSVLTDDQYDYTNAGVIKDAFTNRIVGFSFVEDLAEQHFVDPHFKTHHEKLKANYAGNTVTFRSWTKDAQKITVRVQSPGKPADYFLYDAKAPALSGLGNESPTLAQRPLGKVEALSYSAADGTKIPAYLTLPPGKSRADGPFPLILLPHGGPEARDDAGLDWWAQAYAASGYAVLQPNFRGSKGYGTKFLQAGYGEFGGKMVTDTLDGAAWAEAQGIAKPGGYCIVGASYGGYQAVQGAVLGGSKVKCAVSVNGVVDPMVQISRFDPESDIYLYWTRYLGVARFSDATALAQVKPMERLSELSAPVLAIHGVEDTTVPYDQARILKNAMQNRPDFKLVDIPNEDHYLRSTAARQTVLNESLAFLKQHFPAE